LEVFWFVIVVTVVPGMRFIVLPSPTLIDVRFVPLIVPVTLIVTLLVPTVVPDGIVVPVGLPLVTLAVGPALIGRVPYADVYGGPKPMAGITVLAGAPAIVLTALELLPLLKVPVQVTAT
jgi:hypothetical protein